MVKTQFKKKRRNTKKTMRRQMKGGDDLALFHKLTEDVRPKSQSKILNRAKPLEKPSTNFRGRYNQNGYRQKSHYPSNLL